MPIPGKWTIEQLLRMSMLKGLNSSKKIKLIESYHSFDNLIKKRKDVPSELIQDELFKDPGYSIDNEIENQIDICNKNDYKIINYWDERYPVLLREITHPPLLIFVEGELQSSDSASISIVGTRRCSSYGQLQAERFSSYFASHGIIVTSGLAFGIDTHSHLAAVKAGGISYAVIASGLDMLSPSTAKKNSEKILEQGGAIISEYICGTVARTAYFPQRNRIISGISKATLVVESGEKGGSLITAKFAHDQSREVYAVPGRITSDRSKGTNRLIKNNFAIPALSPSEVLDELGFGDSSLNETKKLQIKFSNQAEELIYKNIGYEPIHIDRICELCGTDIADTLVKLLEMEFRGLLRQLPGKHYIRSG